MLRVLADTGYMATGQLKDKMFGLIVKHDRKSALRVGYKMGGLLLNQVRNGPVSLVACLKSVPLVVVPQGRHEEFRRITFLLLYPTIYDESPLAPAEDQEVSLQEPKEVQQCLADVDVALEQLTLHRAILQLLDEGQTTDKAENITDTVNRFLVRPLAMSYERSEPPRPSGVIDSSPQGDERQAYHILSREVVLRYLQSLLELWQYDVFFTHVMELNDTIAGLPFEKVRYDRPSSLVHSQWCVVARQDVNNLAKDVIETDLPRWVEAAARAADFDDISNAAAILSAIMHTLDDSWLDLATRPSFSEMLGELGMFAFLKSIVWFLFECAVCTVLQKLLWRSCFGQCRPLRLPIARVNVKALCERHAPLMASKNIWRARIHCSI